MVDGLPIGDYAMLADGHSAALVSRAGSIDWWCPERFDAPSAFARLLDPDGGHWSIRPAGRFDVRRRYFDDTLVLETRFRNAEAELVLTDLLALERGSRGHQIGIASPGELVRSIESVSGDVDLLIELVPRLDYARPGATRVERTGETITWTSTDQRLELSSSVATFDIDEHTGVVRARVRLHARQRCWFVLRSHDIDRFSTDVLSTIADTLEAWRSWAGHHHYDGWGAELVRHSSMVLHALTYGPTGALVAAPTTSLPEIVGDEANWDYRYAWIRDASVVLRALRLGTCVDEASRYFTWMARAASRWKGTPILFRVDGSDDLAESTLPHLAGWRGSRPVRVGNAAVTQQQLDVPGHVLDAALTLTDSLGELDDDIRSFLIDLADYVADHWRDPDSGIWEGREGERHYTSSKLMCWVALDRAIRLHDRLHPDDRLDAWTEQRDLVRAEILERGWNDMVGAYTGAFDSDHLDASVLLMPIMGFCEAADPRMQATVGVIERELDDGGLLLRWTGAQDSPFVMCACWLAECHAMAGAFDRAVALVERITSHASDVGLLAEEIDVAAGEMLGNYPQALSHAALICAAATIDRASRATHAPTTANP